MNFLDIYSNNTEMPNFVKEKVRLVAAEFFRVGTDRHAQASSPFRNFANAPRNVSSQHATTPSAAPQMIKL